MTREEKAQVDTALDSRLLLIKAKKNDIQFKKTSCLEKKGALGRGAAEFVRGEVQTNRGCNTQLFASWMLNVPLSMESCFDMYSLCHKLLDA
jgi:hypothetical protein